MLFSPRIDDFNDCRAPLQAACCQGRQKMVSFAAGSCSLPAKLSRGFSGIQIP